MNYRNALILLILVQILYFFPVLFKGEVIFPHNNDIELGSAISAVDDGRISTRAFSDQSNVFIPEVDRHLNGNHRAWLSTWNPSVQFGRPTAQVSGLGKAYILTRVLSLFTDNPFVLYTWVIVVTVFLTGIFLFLLLKSLDLHPVACVSVAMGLSMGVFLSYWLTFLVFLSAICWGIGLLWLITRFIKNQSYALALGISFVTYNIMITGRLQIIVSFVYFVCIYGLVRLWQLERPFKVKASIVLKLFALAVIGFLAATPVFLDLLVKARQSVRLDVDDAFFLTVLPGVYRLTDLGIYMSTLFDAFSLGNGNPVKPGFPVVINGISFTPLYFSLFLLTFVNGVWRRLWPLHVFVFLCFIATLWAPAYLFAVHYLGFHLSKSQLSSGSMIPVFIIGAYAADHILRNPEKEGLVRSAIIFLPFILAGYVMSVYWGVPSKEPNLLYAALAASIVGGVYLFVVTKKGLVLLALAVITVFAYGYNLKLTRPMEHITVSSDVVESIKAETEGGLRFGFVGKKYIIPPNQESLLGLRSVHSYDSLSSKNYQRQVESLSEVGAANYGRHFMTISDDKRLDEDVFSYTGIGLFVSKDELAGSGIGLLGSVDGHNFYRRTPRPVLEAQVTDFILDEAKGALISGSLDGGAGLPVQRLEDMDDFTVFKVAPVNRRTLLFLSRQYHPSWRVSSEAGLLDTVMINDFYQGVLLPPNTETVTLEFKPYVLWAWIPQVLFVLLGLGFICRRVFGRRGCL